MISVKLSNTTQSSIVAMGTLLAKAMKETGNEYLMLNRGVNSVVNIQLSQIIRSIDFNSTNIQVYPATNGKIELIKAINQEYFANRASDENILVTGGGISGLDICLQNIQVEKVLLPPFFWGTYSQILTLRGMPFTCYHNYNWLFENAEQLSGNAVIICDPGNPAGEKYPDVKMLTLIQKLDENGVIVLFDSPYRRLFYDSTDTFFQELMNLEHIVIIESFSKSLGLSGQRIGFIHNTQQSFIGEAALRLMYATNGVNAFAQVLVTRLLIAQEGKKAVNNFKKITTEHIAANIAFLEEKQLLANQFYQESKPLGIFAIVNLSPSALFQKRIGSVGLDYFTLAPFEGIENLSRILVSYPHEKFVSFFRSY